MSLQPEGSQWLRWSLEQVALTLGRRFPDRHVWVVRASHMYLHKFSCYNNFVESNMFGAPEHSPYSPDFGAFCHLRYMLCNWYKCMSRPDVFRDQKNVGKSPSFCPCSNFSKRK